MVLQEQITDDKLQSAPTEPVVQAADLPATKLQAKYEDLLAKLELNSPIPQ